MRLPQRVPDPSLWDASSPLAPVTPVKGEEPAPVCADSWPGEMLHKGTAPESEGLAWCQSRAGPRWLHHSRGDAAWVPHGWTGNVGKGIWDRAPRVLQEGLVCPGGTEECGLNPQLNFHSVFPGTAARGCPTLALLVCPSTAGKHPWSETREV